MIMTQQVDQTFSRLRSRQLRYLGAQLGRQWLMRVSRAGIVRRKGLRICFIHNDIIPLLRKSSGQPLQNH